MSWIHAREGHVVELGNDAQFMRILAAIESDIVCYATEYAADNAFEVIEDYVSGRLSSREADFVKQVLDLLDSDAAELQDLWAVFSTRIGLKAPQAYSPLLQKLGTLRSSDTPSSDKLLDWPLLSAMQSSANANVDDIGVRLNAGISADFEIEVDPEVEGAPEDFSLRPVAMRIGLDGAVETSAAATIPVSFGKIGGATSARGALALNLYFFNKSDVLLGAALARNLGALPNPYSLASMLGARSLQLARIEGAGSLDVQMNAALERGVDFARGASATAGIELGLSTSLKGEFDYFIYRPEGDTGPVRVVVTRRRQRGLTRKLVAGMTVDAAALVKSVKTKVDEHLEEFEDILEIFEEFKTPAKLIEDKLGINLDALSEDPRVQELIAQKLGIQINAETLDGFKALVEARIDRTADLWSGEVERAAQKIVADVLGALPFASQVVGEARLIDKFEDALKEPLEDLITKLQAKVKSEVSGPTANALQTALSKVDNRVSIAASTINARAEAALKPIMRALAHYQDAVNRFSDVLEKAAQAKIELEMSRTVLDERGSHVMLTVDFHVRDAAVQDAYRRLLTGGMDAAASLITSGDTSGGVQIVSGVLKQFAHYRSTNRFVLGVLDFAVTRESILDAHTEFTYSVNGDVTITSQSERRSRISAGGETKEVSFVNVYELASASRERKLGISIEVSKTDEDLERTELTNFLEGLENARLIRAGATNDALAQFNEASAGGNQKRVKARLDVAFELEHEEILRLLSIDSGTASAELSDARARQVRVTAVEEIIEAVGAYDAANIAEYSHHARRMFDMVGFDGSLAENIAALPAFNDHDFKRKLVPELDRAALHPLERAMQWRNRAYDLDNALRLMRAVYFAPDSWDEDDYNRHQRALGRALGSWTSAESRAIVLVSDRVGPYVIAFIGSLVRLAMVPGDAEIPVQVAMKLPDRDLFRVA